MEVSVRYARSPMATAYGCTPERRGLRVFCHVAANVMVRSRILSASIRISTVASQG